ncbi:MAG: DNA gyrase inhibitor YacG [Deltaproteobacteria bacterium]|nr:DNA gyrase inhibitor YacG [Deltaproteobacteria bacterium]
MVEEKVRARCPRCGKLVRWEGNPYRPFCSQRCKLIDLGKWIDEEYHLDGEESPSEEKGGERERG